MALVQVAECRRQLLALHTHGWVELQEIPKSLDRTPSRTLFAWFVDLRLCLARTKLYCYKTLANLHQRARSEDTAESALLLKQQRLDVQMNPQLLTESDRQASKQLEAKQEKLGVASLRIWEMVNILSL